MSRKQGLLVAVGRPQHTRSIAPGNGGGGSVVTVLANSMTGVVHCALWLC
jgi:hypothetical protein